MRDGLAGTVRPDGAVRTGRRSSTRLKRSDARVARLGADVAQQFGDTETAATEPRRRAQHEPRPIDAAPPGPADARPPSAGRSSSPSFPRRSTIERLRIDAIRAVAAFDDDALGKLLVERYATFSSAEKAEAVQTLASRRRYGRMLTEALAKDVVPRRDVPPYVARQLLRVVGAGFTDVWGPVERSADRGADLRADIARCSPTTRSAGANVRQRTRASSSGRAVACHKLYGEGGTLGPDITGSNRANLDYLLFNVLNPNAEVQDAYKMVVVTTRDGRTLAGNVVAETDRQITLRVVGQDARGHQQAGHPVARNDRRSR